MVNKVLSWPSTLHIPGIDRWAEQLGGRELLPSLDHEVYALDAVTLADLPLVFVERKVGSAKFPTWVPGDEDDIAAMFGDPLEVLAAAIEEAPDPEGQFLFGSLKIAESGVSAELHGCLGADYHEYRAGYALAGARSRSGITRRRQGLVAPLGIDPTDALGDWSQLVSPDRPSRR